MNNWIMLINNQVIDILYQLEKPPIWPPDPEGNPVTSMPWEDTSEIEIGMFYEDGQFIEKIIEPKIPIEEEIIEEQAAEIDKTNEILKEVKDIKALLNIDLEVIKQQAIDAFTLELINNGIL